MARKTKVRKLHDRLPIPSGLNKKRGIKGIVLAVDTVQKYCQFVADKCSWLGWTPTALADASGVGYDTCWRHMSGQVKEPRLTTCVAIMAALKVQTKLIEDPKRLAHTAR